MANAHNFAINALVKTDNKDLQIITIIFFYSEVTNSPLCSHRRHCSIRGLRWATPRRATRATSAARAPPSRTTGHTPQWSSPTHRDHLARGALFDFWRLGIFSEPLFSIFGRFSTLGSFWTIFLAPFLVWERGRLKAMRLWVLESIARGPWRPTQMDAGLRGDPHRVATAEWVDAVLQRMKGVEAGMDYRPPTPGLAHRLRHAICTPPPICRAQR